MKLLKYSLVLLILILNSCRKDLRNPLQDLFPDPPIAPITQTIKTVVPVGYAASLVFADMKGYKQENVTTIKQKSTTLLYVDTETNYPYKFKNDTYGEMVVAYIQTDLNSALVSVFFTDMDISTGSLKLKNVIAFPVIFDELTDKITAVFVSVDINIGDNLYPGMDLTQQEIDDNMLKLDNETTFDEYIAIAQNAWIVEIDPGDYGDLYDDTFTVFGGQQAVDVQDYETESSAGVMQMAIINMKFSSDCLQNPTNGYVFMQDVEVSSSPGNNDIVFGQIFYDFHSSCDGDIEVDLAIGSFLFATGKEFDLELK